MELKLESHSLPIALSQHYMLKLNLKIQVCEVMADLKRVSLALGQSENLVQVSESLKKVSGILRQLVEVDGNGSQSTTPKSSADGGKCYVA